MFKLDRTAFVAGSHKELSDKNREYWKSQSMEERLRAAVYLNSVAWNYPLDTPPKMDRSVSSMRKHR